MIGTFRAAGVAMTVGAVLCGPAVNAGTAAAAPAKSTTVSIDPIGKADRAAVEVSGSGTCKGGGIDLHVAVSQDGLEGGVTKHSLFRCDGKPHAWKVQVVGSSATPFGDRGPSEWQIGKTAGATAILYKAETDDVRARIDTSITIERK
ncbi:hypothetical protein ACWDSJ_22875 [Nocardia sp. NPDC003482]